ncbi:glycosyltransferase [Corynebacterium urinipleomorphum]|uniref:glycosyltransferase n=1 Tax=Corynebacterium urinipleomorphum TaxID=1852380 RepID=UPI001F36A237|nr:glycosyltransferase [Corynebacterium urinipleomorphum]
MKVLSIPAEHVYPQAIQPEGVSFHPDPDIDGNWWPHPALEAQWWDTPRDVDLVHIHFGYEHRTPEQLQELVDALPVPLVVTVHDLNNPHLSDPADQERHRANVGVLVRAAKQVVTLTESAAATIAQRYGREDVAVVGHPAVVKHMPEVDAEADAAIFLKSLRANAVADVEFYRAIAARVPLTVYMHDVDATLQLHEELSLIDGITLVRHTPMNDHELHSAVASHRVCILPYVRGTHSGWLEMCRDLGVSVAVPDCGCYADQADTPEAVSVYRTGDGADAGWAAAELLAAGPVPYRGDREAQLQDIKQIHARIYTAALNAGAAR